MDLSQQLPLPPLSSCGRYACLEFLFIEESVKMMQKGKGPPPIRLVRVCFGCPLLVGFQEKRRLFDDSLFLSLCTCATLICLL